MFSLVLADYYALRDENDRYVASPSTRIENGPMQQFFSCSSRSSPLSILCFGRLREIVQQQLPRRAADAILADCFDLTSPAVNVSSIDDLTQKVPGMSIAEEEDDYE